MRIFLAAALILAPISVSQADELSGAELKAEQNESVVGEMLNKWIPWPGVAKNTHVLTKIRERPLQKELEKVDNDKFKLLIEEQLRALDGLSRGESMTRRKIFPSAGADIRQCQEWSKGEVDQVGELIKCLKMFNDLNEEFVAHGRTVRQKRPTIGPSSPDQDSPYMTAPGTSNTKTE